MTRVVDAEGAHLAAVLRAADFTGRRVLEVGCGDGRLTLGLAERAASVVAFDPEADLVAAARTRISSEMREKVRFDVASAEEIEVEPQSIDTVFFSWSL
jgi:ubiquinone/menaquinone biosynthesis C-methylase UbiE